MGTAAVQGSVNVGFLSMRVSTCVVCDLICTLYIHLCSCKSCSGAEQHKGFVKMIMIIHFRV